MRPIYLLREATVSACVIVILCVQLFDATCEGHEKGCDAHASFDAVVLVQQRASKFGFPPVPTDTLKDSAEAPALSRSSASASAQFAPLPTNGKVAVLLRGQSFRSDFMDYAQHQIRHDVDSCDPNALKPQLVATRSLVRKFIEPLEDLNNTVHLFVYESSRKHCHKLIQALLETLTSRTRNQKASESAVARSILASETERAAPDQATGLFEALRLLHNSGNYNASAYDLILITRHDLVWSKPVVELLPPASFDRLNLMSRCQNGKSVDCMNDWIFLMPGKLFGSFEVWMQTCWANSKGVSDDNVDAWMNYCATYLRRTSPSGIAYLTDWRPRARMREGGCPVANPLASVNLQDMFAADAQRQ